VKEFGPSTFGELYAEDYDEFNDPGTTDEAVALIADVAGSGTVLELAIGTGRVALPLAERGLAIQGVEGSPQMVAKLREKPGGESIPVSIGDYADVAVDGSFDHIFLIFNTLFNLPTQSEQVRCFQNAAKHLTDGGTFLVEAYVPDMTEFRDGQNVRARQVGFDTVMLEAAVPDPVNQIVEYQRIQVTREGIRLRPPPIRYAWPAEIDLMANLAGLRLQKRWGDWHRSPFTADSTMHVLVYEKPGNHAAAPDPRPEGA